jgi:hypothetical protein
MLRMTATDRSLRNAHAYKPAMPPATAAAAPLNNKQAWSGSEKNVGRGIGLRRDEYNIQSGNKTRKTTVSLTDHHPDRVQGRPTRRSHKEREAAGVGLVFMLVLSCHFAGKYPDCPF